MPNTRFHRRQWLKTTAAAGITMSLAAQHGGASATETSANVVAPPLREIGSRRELFVDSFLIEQRAGLELQLQQPRLEAPLTTLSVRLPLSDA